MGKRGEVDLKRVFLFILLVCLAGCRQETKVDPADFESLMGKGKTNWTFVRTPEDYANLAFFKKIWEERKDWPENEEPEIPKTLHFVWLGPKPLPIKSIENIKSWVHYHPDWKIKLWFDRPRPLPVATAEEIIVNPERDLPHLAPFYHKSNNWAEKSDLLRYEFLFREGGIYVDHDVKCFRSFEPLIHQYALFFGLDLPYVSPLSSSVHPTNCLIGMKKDHPVGQETIEWIAEHWNLIEEMFPTNDFESTISRVAHRSFYAFAMAAKKGIEAKKSKGIAFPSFYFSAPSDEFSLYARHQYAGTWFENETQFEKQLRSRLKKITKKINLLYTILGTGFIFQCALLLFFGMRKRNG